MINRVLGYLSQEVRGLHAAAYILAGAALLSSVLALARDRLFAHTFGAGTTLDVYYAAFRIPDLIFVATGALVSVYILIPELARRAPEEQKKYLDTILAGFSLFACVVAAIAAIFAPFFSRLLFPQLALGGHIDELVSLTRLMLLQPIFLGLSNILAAVTQARHRYALYALSPLLYNLGIIVGVGVLYPLFGLQGLAWGVVLGALLHAAVQVPAVVNDGFLAGFPRIYDTRALVQTVVISLPRALALSMSQIAFLGLTAFAGMLAPGSIAIFMLAYNLQAVPLSVIGASYSVAAFPTLAQALSNGEKEVFLEHVATAARYVFFWSMPAMALVIVLRAYLVRVILGSGAFDWTDTRLTAAVFALLSISLAAQGLSLLFIRAYYAAGRTFVPFLISCGTAAATLVLALFFLAAFKDPDFLSLMQRLLRLQGVPGASVLALGLGFAFAAIGGAVAIVLHFERRFGGLFVRIRRAFSESILAALAGGAAAYAMLELAGPIDVGSTTFSVLLRGFAGGATGLIVAGACYALLGNREIQEVIAAARLRISRVAQPFGGTVAVATSAEEQGGTVS